MISLSLQQYSYITAKVEYIDQLIKTSIIFIANVTIALQMLNVVIVSGAAITESASWILIC